MYGTEVSIELRTSTWIRYGAARQCRAISGAEHSSDSIGHRSARSRVVQRVGPSCADMALLVHRHEVYVRSVEGKSPEGTKIKSRFVLRTRHQRTRTETSVSVRDAKQAMC
ncbi:hypothetical protein EVAR_10880_1 [Eumeta japonica]|uniref:Uncharacterized protein n=1 Tax=Eumeta variegata TaxID=151549 RepID=A0A4C1UTB5_EUMVA|nr:hypothetical protein EVAR_10880_1 [Eumeta japonica]